MAVLTISVLYVLLPELAGLKSTWSRLNDGDPSWLLAAAFLELSSYGSYVVAFRAVFDGSAGIGWRQSYRVTMAGVAATRLLATAGAGGIVLTVWALNRFGMPRREIADRMSTFLVLLYGLFMSVLVIDGIGLRTGVLPGPAPFGLTVVPAIFGGIVIVVSLSAAAFSSDLGSAASRLRAADGRLSRLLRAAATAPAALATGVRGTVEEIRRASPALPGAIGWWAFDIAVLYASLRAFGGDPEVAVVVMAYFVGMLANTLPVPGGIGAVDGGMIGALIGFGLPAGLAIVGVLTYRLFAFWLPIVPGVIAYVQLLRTEPAPTGSRSGAAPS